MAFIIGIDEAGRGPLAGPVAVGAVKISPRARKFLKGIRDSKKLSEREREAWFALALEAKAKGELDFAVALVSERIIDRRGISYAVRLGIKRALSALGVTEESQVYLDGGIRAPDNFKHQISIVKGDEKVPVISLASILAKVVRDRRMVKLSGKFPQFGLERHKGYGTRAHREAILKHGPAAIHRKTFLTRLTNIV